MLGLHLRMTFRDLSNLGLVRSKRHFSRTYLGRGWSYLRDIEQRDRDEFRVPPATVSLLRARLQALVNLLSPEAADQIKRVIMQIDQHNFVSDTLGYRSRRRR